MPDIDDIINRLLGSRRIKEGATFSSRTYSDEPIIERGSDFKARMERRNAERSMRHQREASERQAQRRTARPDAKVAQGQRPTNWSFDLNLSPGAQRLADHAMQAIRRPEPLPEPLRQMRALEGHGVPSSMAYGSKTAAALFYQQAHLMASYEDDYDYHGTFQQYYPTYSAMSDQQLRGYFAWRTRVRRGQVDAVSLSFAFVYVYELLCGAGTTPGIQTLQRLQDFGLAYRDADEHQGAQLMSYLGRWMRDYAVYHDVAHVLPKAPDEELNQAILTMLCSEYDFLAREGRSPRIGNPFADGSAPSADELFAALGTAASYHICEARLAKDEPQLVRDVATDTFRTLVLHCSKRRKTDYVEGLFGYVHSVVHTMFSAAIFYDPVPHPDATVTISPTESFVFSEGTCRHNRVSDARGRNTELGLAMHAVDYELRQALGYAYPLKRREVPKYLEKIVKASVAARLEERREKERRTITIDRSKLGGIRAAAALTQDALLTDEERDDVAAAPAMPETPVADAPSPTAQDAPTGQASIPFDLPPMTALITDTPPAAPAAEGGIAAQADTMQEPASPDALLTPLEARLLAGLLEGVPASELLSPTDPFVSVVADTINEKLFDLVGDAVIEFAGDEPMLIEDYLEDIREVLDS